jgi:SAM-dependent methyltransferase
VDLHERIPEPELMEAPEQAQAYSEADFAPAHDAVVAMLIERQPEAADQVERALDLGCGPADVTVRLARALPRAQLVGIDAGSRMLALGRERVAREDLDARVRLLEVHLPADDRLSDLGPFDLVASNSLLHHLAEPGALWSAVSAAGRPGAIVHVVDLLRPPDVATVDRLVGTYAAGEPDVLVEDFRASLKAAYRLAEVEDQLRASGLDRHLAVEQVSDRHLLVHGRLPPTG